MARQKILVVDSDLDILSRIYLSLLHRNYNVEASDKAEEVLDRIKRFKPALLILEASHYNKVRDKLKTTTIVLTEKDQSQQLNYGDVQLTKPFQTEKLIKLVEDWII